MVLSPLFKRRRRGTGPPFSFVRLAMLDNFREKTWNVERKTWSGCSGGEGEIRTPERVPPLSAFEADRFNHSRTSPRRKSGSGYPDLGIELSRTSSDTSVADAIVLIIADQTRRRFRPFHHRGHRGHRGKHLQPVLSRRLDAENANKIGKQSQDSYALILIRVYLR